MQAHRNEGVVKDIISATVYDLDQQHSDLFMKNSVITDPEPLEQTVDISHLSKYKKSLFLPLKDNYQQIFSRHKHSIGRFPYWKCKVNVNPYINCQQKQRAKLIPESAYLDLMKYKDSGVFCDSKSGADKYIANITLTQRPSARELKFSTQADKYLSRLSDKSNSKKDDKNPASDQTERQLNCITLD